MANLTLPAAALDWLAEWSAQQAGGTGPAGGTARGPAGTGASNRRGGPGPCPACGKPGSPGLPALENLAFPLLTLLGLAERPGEAHGLGALDPGLIRDLAAAGARHPGSEFCVTITDDQGHAIGHGCCRPLRASKARAVPAATGRVTFAPSGQPGPDGGFGSWTMTLPGAAARSGWTSTPSRPTPATTASPPPATTPAPSCATSSRSGTASAPSPPADATPASQTSSTPGRSPTAAPPAAATATPAAGPATASSSHEAGTSPSHDPAGPAGPPWPAESTSKAPGATQHDQRPARNSWRRGTPRGNDDDAHPQGSPGERKLLNAPPRTGQPGTPIRPGRACPLPQDLQHLRGELHLGSGALPTPQPEQRRQRDRDGQHGSFTTIAATARVFPNAIFFPPCAAPSWPTGPRAPFRPHLRKKVPSTATVIASPSLSRYFTISRGSRTRAGLTVTRRDGRCRSGILTPGWRRCRFCRR